jgi:RNA ligase
VWPFPVVKRFDGVSDIEALRALERDNAEGFVIRFESGLRLKLKFAEYVRLHHIITHVNARVIWELLRDNKPFDELLERVPDEFFAWVRQTCDDLLQRFASIEVRCREVVSRVQTLPTRKEQAAIVTKERYPGIVFAMLDNKNYRDMIWRLLYPEASRPFVVDEEN